MNVEDLDKKTLVQLLDLPDHLRRTALAIIELGRATASEVAAKTGRARAIESHYLNELVRLGSVRREGGRPVYFYWWSSADR